MIAHLRGRLIAKHPNQAIVETGGVGYDVVISVPTFSELPGIGGEVALHIHTHVREDQIALFGFVRPEEKQLFEKLLGVSGIGPKLAITILSGMAAPDMVAAIRETMSPADAYSRYRQENRRAHGAGTSRQAGEFWRYAKCASGVSRWKKMCSRHW